MIVCQPYRSEAIGELAGMVAKAEDKVQQCALV